LRLYKQASEKGFLPAFAADALIYSNGLAGVADHQEAMRWLERGAAAGDPFSHIRLAELFEEGNRIPKDIEQASLHWGNRRTTL
jgi:TPR repeat protein